MMACIYCALGILGLAHTSWRSYLVLFAKQAFETKTGWLCHPSHTDGSTMASRNPETKQHHKVLMLKDHVQAIKKSQQGQSVRLIA